MQELQIVVYCTIVLLFYMHSGQIWIDLYFVFVFLFSFIINPFILHIRVSKSLPSPREAKDFHFYSIVNLAKFSLLLDTFPQILRDLYMFLLSLLEKINLLFIN